MKKKLLILSFLCLSLNAHFNNLVPKKEVKSMTTSVIVPCVARHFFWLSGLLESYQHQTVVPDEIVVSLSEVEKLEPKHIDNLENGLWDFKLKILRNKGVILDGDNRTIAMDNSTGEILIFSDADDLPHPQRVEISKFFLENYEVDHILHGLTFDRKDITGMNVQDMTVLRFSNLDQIIKFKFKFLITTGSPCFLRKVADRIKWHAIKDREYNRQVYKLFKNNIVLPFPLILYRIHLSSHRVPK